MNQLQDTNKGRVTFWDSCFISINSIGFVFNDSEGTRSRSKLKHLSECQDVSRKPMVFNLECGGYWRDHTNTIDNSASIFNHCWHHVNRHSGLDWNSFYSFHFNSNLYFSIKNSICFIWNVQFQWKIRTGYLLKRENKIFQSMWELETELSWVMARCFNGSTKRPAG